MMAKKLMEFENMRGIAILAVVIIHVTAEATVTYSPVSIRYFFYNIVNSFLQFAVPLFLFISSVILSWKMTKEEASLSQFYRKRLPGVLIPYFVWSFLYIIFKALIYRGSMSLSPGFVVKELVNGTAYYHLYFLLIIIQLYFFLPFFNHFLRKIKWSQMLLLTVLLQVLFYSLNKNWIYQLYPHPANLLGSYFSVFIIGCWLGLNYQQVKCVLFKYKGYFWLLHALLAVLFITINIKLRIGEPIGLVTYYGAYHLFVLASSLSIWLFSLQIQSSFLQGWGDHSFAIYLVHPFFLAVWHYLGQKIGLVSNDLFFLLGFLFTISLSYLVSCVLARSRILRHIFLAR